MNRIIKFRGKSLNTKILVYGDLSHKGKRTFIEYEVYPETVNQFTGLLDKTSKEIYEGDVLKSSITIGIPNTCCCHEIGELFVVVCMLSGYTLMSMRDYHYENRRSTPNLAWNLDNKFLWNYHDKFEVIGNIHDNPELINS